MTEVRRISPAEARQKVESGTALFVCAYESEALCQRNHLEGGISLTEFRERLPAPGTEQEIIFYCA